MTTDSLRKLLEDCARKLGYLVRDYPGDKESRDIIERIGAALATPMVPTPAGVADVLAVHTYAQSIPPPPLTAEEVEALQWARVCVVGEFQKLGCHAQAIVVLDRLIATGGAK